MADNEMTLEERFTKIEEILQKMESKEVTLDTAFSLYKDGLNELKACNEALDQVEKAMLVINGNGELVPF